MLLLFLFGINFMFVSSFSPRSQAYNRLGRSIGSVDAIIEDYPYTIQVENNYGRYICGGVIISKHIVLTAGHCLSRRVEHMIKIRSGTTIRSQGGVVHDVDARMIHKSYSVNDLNNSKFDIGIVLVRQPFECDSYGRSIDLNKHVLTPDQVLARKAVMTGWGTTSFKGSLSNRLLALEVPVYSKSFCNDNYKPFGGITEGQICAGYVGVRNKEACPGDSGSPLVYNGKLIGLVGYGEGKCGQLDHPTVYTEVAYFYDWIKQYLDYDEIC